MQNFSVKKLSILGLVLLTASAVTAAFIPAKSNTAAGRLVQAETTDANTCIETDVRIDCNYEDSGTTGATPDVSGAVATNNNTEND